MIVAIRRCTGKLDDALDDIADNFACLTLPLNDRSARKLADMGNTVELRHRFRRSGMADGAIEDHATRALAAQTGKISGIAHNDTPV